MTEYSTKKNKGLLVLVSFAVVLGLSACSSNSAKTPLKVLSQLFGGLQDRSQLIEENVEEEMQREVSRCLDNVEDNPELRSQCVTEAYEKVKERKDLDQSSDEGTVTVREVDDGEVVGDEPEEEQDEPPQDNEQ